MKKELCQSHYWDRAAGEKKFTTHFQMDEFKRFIHLEAGILDMGCGYGRTLNELKTGGFTNLVGADYSIKMIERAKKLDPGYTLVQSNERLSFRDKSFDAVIVSGVLTCIVNAIVKNCDML